MHNVPIQHHAPPALPVVTPWMLRAWPPLLWQAGEPARMPFHHLGTHVTMPNDAYCPLSGQTIWAASNADGEAGMAWDWVQIARGVVALADPMCVVTNLRLLSDDGEVLTAHASARFLNELVHALPWQTEVARALQIGHA